MTAVPSGRNTVDQGICSPSILPRTSGACGGEGAAGLEEVPCVVGAGAEAEVAPPVVGGVLPGAGAPPSPVQADSDIVRADMATAAAAACTGWLRLMRVLGPRAAAAWR